MYKLLVVDDEFNIRDGIVHAVPWHTCGVEVSGEAENGVQALQRVRETKPDLVISDISMDEMDGLEFVDQLKQIHPDVKVLILSGYDEFDYAKRALQLKVSGYLLKPVSPNELMEAVQGLIVEIRDEARLKEHITNLESEIRINRELHVDRLLHDLAEGAISDHNELDERLALIEMRMDGPRFCCLVMALDDYHAHRDHLGVSGLRLLLHQADELFRQVMAPQFEVWTFIGQPGHVIAFLGGEGTPRGLHGLLQRLEKLRVEMRRILSITITVAVGGTLTDMSDINASHAQALKALDLRMTAGPDTIIHIDDAIAMNHDQFVYPHDRETAVLGCLAEGRPEELRQAIEAFFSEMEKRNCTREHLRIAAMEFFAVVARRFMDLGLDIHADYERELLDPYRVLERFDSIGAVCNWMANVVIHAAQALREKRVHNVKRVVTHVQDYISAHYQEPDISLNSIAEHVHFNAAYLSKLYKKETGENYLEFLTRLRLDRARQLLRTTTLRTSDVGQAVGYPNPQYFATLFRKTTGMSPVEFREGG